MQNTEELLGLLRERGRGVTYTDRFNLMMLESLLR